MKNDYRVILHCDLNSFYVSVEMKYEAALKGKAVAVCGNTDSRHGIVLAKSEEAKKFGVSTGEAVWQAKAKCPSLIVVHPHYDRYLKYSRMAKKIYEDYTDLVESFGIDEAWLDVTGSVSIFGDGEKIALMIKERIKNELGITASVGVSFNKVFSKLGSDMKKPDAITVIPPDKFRNIIRELPVSSIIGIGNSTKALLKKYGILTLGELADADVNLLRQKLGKCGYLIWKCANGYENSPVAANCYNAPLKSIGHGTTAVRDLHSDEEVWRILYELSQDVARRLRENKLMPMGVRVSIRTKDLEITQHQGKLETPCQSFEVLSCKAFELFRKNYDWKKPIRSLTVTAIDLVSEHMPVQINLCDNPNRLEKLDRSERAIEAIREKYGKNIINMCSLFLESNMAPNLDGLSSISGKQH